MNRHRYLSNRGAHTPPPVSGTPAEGDDVAAGDGFNRHSNKSQVLGGAASQSTQRAPLIKAGNNTSPNHSSSNSAPAQSAPAYTSPNDSSSNSTPAHSDWSPLDDGIEISPHFSSSRENVDALINRVLYGPSRRKRLPVFTEICPSEK